MTTSSEPPSDPDATRKIVARVAAQVDALQKAEAKRDGATVVVRWVGGIAASVAISMGGVALVFAQQAAVDHEVVVRSAAEIDTLRDQLDAIRSALAAQTAILERVERRLDREGER
jgi:hypothetical protein